MCYEPSALFLFAGESLATVSLVKTVFERLGMMYRELAEGEHAVAEGQEQKSGAWLSLCAYRGTA
jgi:hypothetical protein